MKIVEKNEELEEEIDKQEQSLQKQELFLIYKIEELKTLSERYEKLSKSLTRMHRWCDFGKNLFGSWSL